MRYNLCVLSIKEYGLTLIGKDEVLVEFVYFLKKILKGIKMNCDLVLNRTVSDFIKEYNFKKENLDNEIENFIKQVENIKMASSIGGHFGDNIFYRSDPSVDRDSAYKALLISGWRCLYSRLGIDKLATADDKRKWDMAIANPPPLTPENVMQTFSDYLFRMRFHVLRGLAEVFVKLDPAYKSHSKVKIGVKGLPKRIIIESVSGYGSYGRDKIRDMFNALAAYRNEPLIDYKELEELDRMSSWINSKSGEVQIRGITVKKFLNSNAHIIFDEQSLLDINKALAEFYGDVLPDAEGEEPNKVCTAISKDLQFYPTPQKIIDKLIEAVNIPNLKNSYQSHCEPMHILEPSCGDGRMMIAVKNLGHDVVGFELDYNRFEECKKLGLNVVKANFLEQPPQPIFDRVIMNPPFYGKHYVHHITHALKFLKPNGVLVSVLPATAWYDHKLIKGIWTDLPVGSFSEIGTNIPTGFIVIKNTFI